MTNQNYSIDDGDGNQITAGLPEQTARRTAQRIANERGESVYLYASPVEVDEDGEAIDESEEIAPATKADVRSWDTVATYVATYPSDGDQDGACDVSVQIGEAGGLWFVRTSDDGGGSDDADATAYDSEEAATEAAEAFAADRDEGIGEDAEAYLDRMAAERAGEPTVDGEWCVYWSTALDDAGPRGRYATEDQASAAAQIANKELAAANPGGNLLCGYEVRALVDGEWVEVAS